MVKFSNKTYRQQWQQTIERFNKTYRRLNKKRVFGVFGGICTVVFLFAYTSFMPKPDRLAAAFIESGAKLGSLPMPAPSVKYDLITDDFDTQTGEVKNGEFLSTIMTKFGIPYTDVDKLVKKSSSVFDVRKIRIGNPYLFLSDKETKKAQYFIYEPSPYNFVVYDLRDTFSVKLVERKVTSKTSTASGVVTSSLWDALATGGINHELAVKMEQALAWSIDFHHIQKNDRFKLIYDQNLVEGKPVGVGQLKAAYFQQAGQDYYAIHFKGSTFEGYYDHEGRPAKKAFLKAPVEYARISSGFNLRRFHPILRRVKAHLGTDYAAPYGTPIITVADGVVTEAKYSGGNGRYVKVKHDKTYETQYLHMSKFAVKPGEKVRQGQTIGYVGSTGLATGPHVCFRFWKNGQQVNHLAEKLPRPEPLPAQELAQFYALRDSIKLQMDLIRFSTENDEDADKTIRPDSTKRVNP